MEPHVDRVTCPVVQSVGRHFPYPASMEYVNEPPQCTCAGLTAAAAPEEDALDGDLEGDLDGDADAETAFTGALEGALEGASEGALEGALVGGDVTLCTWARVGALLAAVQLTVSTADPVLDPQAPISRVTQPEAVAEHCDFLRSAVQPLKSSLLHGP